MAVANFLSRNGGGGGGCRPGGCGGGMWQGGRGPARSAVRERLGGRAVSLRRDDDNPSEDLRGSQPSAIILT